MRVLVDSTFGRAAILVLALTTPFLAGPAGSTDLSYTLLSPNFGGPSAVAMQMEQSEQALKTAKAAAAAAAAKASVPVDPNQPFINAIISQLNGIVAQTVAQKIANATAGQAGTITSGNMTITYVNSDGQLSVTISSPMGTTTLTIPAGL